MTWLYLSFQLPPSSLHATSILSYLQAFPEQSSHLRAWAPATSLPAVPFLLPALMSSNWLPLSCPLGVGELPLLHCPICHSVTPPTCHSSLYHSIHTSILYYNVLFLCMPFFLEGRFCSLSLGTLSDSSLYSLCLVGHLTHESIQ